MGLQDVPAVTPPAHAAPMRTGLPQRRRGPRRAPRLWPEIPVAASIDTPRGPVVIEGIIDLLYQDDDGELVILDYKSDRVDDYVAADAKLEHYRMQGVAYAATVERATGNTVKAVQFLFVQLQDGRTLGQ